MPSRRTFKWIAAVVATTFFCAGGVWLVLQADDTPGAIIGLAGALIGLADAFWAAIDTSLQRTRPPSAQQLDDAARWLCDELATRVRDAKRYPAFATPEPVAISWWLREPIYSPQALHQEQQRGGTGARELITRVASAGAPRIALVGQAGAGKSTLVASLAQDLLPTDPSRSHPVPVVFSLTDWTPGLNTLDQWLTIRLAADYPELRRARRYGGDAPAALVARRRIMPLLDNLDEVSAEVRNDAVEQIRALPSSLPLVVACRTAEYDALVPSGRFAPKVSTVEIEPLTSRDVIDFLRASAEGYPQPQVRWWAHVGRHLRTHPDDVLAIALDTPLYAWLLWRSYIVPGRDPALLLDRSVFRSTGDIEEHLLRGFLPAVLSERSARDRQYLRFLARQIASRDMTTLTWWQIPYMVPSFVRRLLTILAAGALLFPIALSDQGLAFWAGSALVIGLVPRLEPRSALHALQVHVFDWKTTHDRRRRSAGIGFAFGAALAVGLLVESQSAADRLGAITTPLVGGVFAVSSEFMQAAFAAAASRLRLPPRPLEARDAPPPVIGLSLDWSRVALAAAVGGLFGFSWATLYGVGGGLASGLALALSLSPFAWFGKSSQSFPVQQPARLLKANLKYSLLRGVLLMPVALAIVIPMVLTSNNASGSSGSGPTASALEVGAILALALIGLAVAFASISVLIAPCGQYALSVAFLSAGRRLPLRPLRFLDDMLRLDVFRQAGLGYEFRHERLRETIASDEEPAPV